MRLPFRWIFDNRHCAPDEHRALLGDLEWYELTDDIGIEDLAPAALQADPVWRLQIPGRRAQLLTESGAEPVAALDARTDSPEILDSILKFNGATPKECAPVVIDARSSAWLEPLAARLSGEPWAQASHLKALGHGGEAELARNAFRLRDDSHAACQIPATTVLLRNEFWVLAGDSETGKICADSQPSLGSCALEDLPIRELFSYENRPKIREPRSGSNVEPIRGTQVLLLPAERGTYKVSLEMRGEEWSLQRVEDDAGNFLGYAASGPGLGRVTFPLLVSQSEARQRPLAIRQVAASRNLRQGKAAPPLLRAWLSYFGEDFHEFLPGEPGGTEPNTTATLLERLAIRLPESMIRERRVWRLSAGNPWLDVEIERETGALRPPELRLSLPGFSLEKLPGPQIEDWLEGCALGQGSMSAFLFRRHESENFSPSLMLVSRPNLIDLQEATPGLFILSLPPGGHRLAMRWCEKV